MDADLDDPLIDLELHDIVDIVRVFSILAKPPQNQLSASAIDAIPKLFDDHDGP